MESAESGKKPGKHKKFEFRSKTSEGLEKRRNQPWHYRMIPHMLFRFCFFVFFTFFFEVGSENLLPRRIFLFFLGIPDRDRCPSKITQRSAVFVLLHTWKISEILNTVCYTPCRSLQISKKKGNMHKIILIKDLSSFVKSKNLSLKLVSAWDLP